MMMRPHHSAMYAILILIGLRAGVACGDAEPASDAPDDDLGAGERGGPQSLSGITWRGPAQVVNGVELRPSLAFSERQVTVTNTCQGTLTASVSAPVRYHYQVRIERGARQQERDGQRDCFVEIKADTFDFSIEQGKLIYQDGESSYEFAAEGGVAGLYGTWVTAAPGVGRLRWSMGKGRLRAQALCDNGLTATVEAPARFTNFMTILEPASHQVERDGLECFASIEAATMTYRFEDRALWLGLNGQELRLEP